MNIIIIVFYFSELIVPATVTSASGDKTIMSQSNEGLVINFAVYALY